MAREEGIAAVISVAFNFYFVCIHVFYVNDKRVCMCAEVKRQPKASLLKSYPPFLRQDLSLGPFLWLS